MNAVNRTGSKYFSDIGGKCVEYGRQTKVVTLDNVQTVNTFD